MRPAAIPATTDLDLRGKPRSLNDDGGRNDAIIYRPARCSIRTSGRILGIAYDECPDRAERQEFAYRSPALARTRGAVTGRSRHGSSSQTYYKARQKAAREWEYSTRDSSATNTFPEALTRLSCGI